MPVGTHPIIKLCKKCQKQFQIPDGRFKYCQDCRTQPIKKAPELKFCRACGDTMDKPDESFVITFEYQKDFCSSYCYADYKE